MLVTLYRDGTFKMRSAATPTKCGPPKLEEFRYEVWIATPEESLDSNGFVLDTSKITEFFVVELAREPFESCERLALKAIKKLSALVPHAWVQVRIWNGSNVWAEANSFT